MKKLFLVAAMAVAVSPVMASAASVGLTVTGNIVPTSCTPSFAGGTNVDLGQITLSSLSPTAQNNLPEHDISLNIRCDAPAAVEFGVKDNRAATKAPNLVFSPTGFFGENLYYGLGNAGSSGVGLGGFGLRVGKATTDNREQTFLVRTPDNLNWRLPGSRMVSNFPTTYSWGLSAAAGPAAARVHTFEMKVAAAIRPTNQLPATTTSFKVDGSVIFDVFYL
jgi:type 1 fimbria pilin